MNNKHADVLGLASFGLAATNIVVGVFIHEFILFVMALILIGLGTVFKLVDFPMRYNSDYPFTERSTE